MSPGRDYNLEGGGSVLECRSEDPVPVPDYKAFAAKQMIPDT